MAARRLRTTSASAHTLTARAIVNSVSSSGAVGEVQRAHGEQAGEPNQRHARRSGQRQRPDGHHRRDRDDRLGHEEVIRDGEREGDDRPRLGLARRQCSTAPDAVATTTAPSRRAGDSPSRGRGRSVSSTHRRATAQRRRRRARAVERLVGSSTPVASRSLAQRYGGHRRCRIRRRDGRSHPSDRAEATSFTRWSGRRTWGGRRSRAALKPSRASGPPKPYIS